MNPYERVMAVLESRKDETDRIPCASPSSTATIEFMEKTGAFWPEAHKDPEKMAKLGAAAHRICGLENITIPFDFTVEAEIFGAPIDFREKAAKKGKILWPSSKRFVLEDPDHIFVPEGFPHVKRVPVIAEAIKILKKEYENEVPVNVFMVPPFTSLSSYLVDTIKFMMWMRMEPEKVHRFMEIMTEKFTEIGKVYEEAGADIITFHEMAAPTDNISPENFEEFVKPYLKKLIGSFKCKTILNICGSTDGIVDKMAECGADGITVDEKASISHAREKIDGVKKGYPLIGNISPKKVIHEGTPEKIRESVKRVIEEGVDIVAPGCDFWIGTPTEKIKIFVEAVTEFGKK
ncbi:MAG: MtaA/CmuA family methyltransferase [Candidatus Syntropharchaeia archaeon]